MAEEMRAVPEGEVADDEKLWALLCYIFCPLVGIIALLLEERNRPFIKYNAWVSIILGVIVIISSWACIGVLVWFYALYLGIKSYGGEWVEVPVVSDFVRNQGWV